MGKRAIGTVRLNIDMDETLYAHLEAMTIAHGLPNKRAYAEAITRRGLPRRALRGLRTKRAVVEAMVRRDVPRNHELSAPIWDAYAAAASSIQRLRLLKTKIPASVHDELEDIVKALGVFMMAGREEIVATKRERLRIAGGGDDWT